VRWLDSARLPLAEPCQTDCSRYSLFVDDPAASDELSHSQQLQLGRGFALGGATVFAIGCFRRSTATALFGLAASAIGAAALARVKLAERAEKISEATANVRADIQGLDPVARAQVLKDIARDDIF